MNLDLFYGIISAIQLAVIFYEGTVLLRKINKNPAVFFSSFMLRPYKLLLGITFLSAAAFSISLFYFISIFKVITSANTFIWEYGNMIGFSFLIIAYAFISSDMR
jgi:hypothetical protein